MLLFDFTVKTKNNTLRSSIIYCQNKAKRFVFRKKMPRNQLTLEAFIGFKLKQHIYSKKNQIHLFAYSETKCAFHSVKVKKKKFLLATIL